MEFVEKSRAFPAVGAAALVFLAAGAVLMLEILAVRMLAPYVGLTLEATTSIIGAALGGIAVGAGLGGYFADRTDTRRLIVGLFIAGGLLTLLTVPVVHWLGPGVRGDGSLAALGITTIALVPAAATLSAVSPAVAHLQLSDLRSSGTIVGSLSGWATTGALVGTFGTGFVIVPLLSVSAAVLIIGLALIFVGTVLGFASNITRTPATLLVIAVLTVGVGAFNASANSPCLRETKYHCLTVKMQRTTSGEDGFHLVLDGDSNSYVNLDDPKHIQYPYVRWIAKAIDSKYPGDGPIDAVFVGGGGFTLPRWLEATRPASHSHVLEVDGGTVDFVEERLGLHPSPKFQVTVDDARISILQVETDSVDVVVGDAFSGLTVPWHLTTSEWLDEVERVLKPDGLYAMNIIDLPPLNLLKAEINTFMGSFSSESMITYINEAGEPAGGNAILLGSNGRIPTFPVPSSSYPSGLVDESDLVSFAGEASALTDDHAPVDQLLTTE
jgi:hypothetical protein